MCIRIYPLVQTRMLVFTQKEEEEKERKYPASHEIISFHRMTPFPLSPILGDFRILHHLYPLHLTHWILIRFLSFTRRTSKPQMTNPLNFQEEVDPVLASQLHITPHEVSTILQYLSLPPSTSLPIPALQFLSTHLSSLPPSLAVLFSKETTPKSRAAIVGIRNRRFRWASQVNTPGVLQVGSGRERHPLLFERIVGSGVELPQGSSSGDHATEIREGDDQDDEEVWGQMKGVLGGKAKVGKFGALMKGFEEEREGERRRGLRREEIKAERETGEEFESDSDGDDDESENGDEERRRREEDTFWGEKGEDRIQVFERILRERWMDGLEDLDYDAVDYDEIWDESSTESFSQDAWFDDEPASSPSGDILAERGLQTSGLAEGEYDY